MILKTNLFPHQMAAVDKLLKIRIGALYMEMGTGKTRTALEFIQRRLVAGKIKHVLWLCPCSVKANLRDDIAKHAEGAFVHIAIFGIESLSGSRRIYNLLMRYVSIAPTMLIIDESLLIKNPRAIRTRRITSIAEACPYRMILNGTPIGKNEADLYAQWYLLDWRVLGYQSFYSFAANHLEYDEKYRHKVRRVLNVDYLTDKIAPYSYMAKKEDCLLLPGKNKHVKYFWLTDRQLEEYRETMDGFLSTFMDYDGEMSDVAIYRTFTALQEVTSGRIITTAPNKPMRHDAMFEPDENPRIKCLLEAIGTFDDDKIVIWCKFQHEINDVSSILRRNFGNGSVVQFSGAISQKKRQAALGQFCKNARFLVANKTCAGFGLNLQFCHNAIYYNNDWDRATRVQSEDRLHRLGQEKDVEIVDICASGTIDQRILDCLGRKERLADLFRDELKKRNGMDWLLDRGEER